MAKAMCGCNMKAPCTRKHPPLGHPDIPILPPADYDAMMRLLANPNFVQQVVDVFNRHNQAFQLEIWYFPDRELEIYVLDEPASDPNRIILRYHGSINMCAGINMSTGKGLSSSE